MLALLLTVSRKTDRTMRPEAKRMPTKPITGLLKRSGALRLRSLLVASLVLALGGCGILGGEDMTPPESPSGLSAASQDGAIALNWNAVQADDLAGYSVYRSTSSGVSTSGSPLDKGVSPAEYLDKTVENGTTYYYVVTAVDEAENESDPSGEVDKTPFSNPPDRP